MEEFVDYYEILELEKNAPIEEIEEAIKKTRKRFRRLEGSPDAMQRANAERMMQLLNEADSLFHNSSKRLEYDATYDSGKSDSKRDLEKDARAATAEKDWTSEAKDYFKNGQSANACFAAREATRNCSTDAEAWLVWALAAYSMDKYDESIFAASELLKLGSNQATAHRLLGDSYIMIDKYADAEAEFLKAQQIDKSDYTIMARLVDARYLQGKFDQALTMARNLHEAHPDYGPVLSSLCRCLETDVENKMSSKDNAGYFTNMKQIQHAELVVSEMRALGNIDKADEEWIEKMEGLIDWARKRHYIAPARWFWILCGLTFLFMISGSSGALLTLVLFFGLLLYAFFFVVPTGWMINARKLGELAKEDGAPIMDVRWDQALDSLEMDRQAIIDCAERLRASLASLKSDSREIKDLATGEAYAGLFSELLLAVDRVKNEPLSEDLRSSIADEIIEVCSHYGLESVLCDETVNLHEHEIVGLIKTDDAFKDGKVARVERDGYRIGGRLLRPARVVVFRHEED